MRVIDAQIHTWLSDRPSRPWDPGYRLAHRDKLPYLQHAGQTNTPEMALLEMAEVGVDAAILSPIGVYGTDNGYELDAAERYPSRFRVLGWIDHLADDVEDRLARDVARGMVGVRIPALREAARHERGEFDRVLTACQHLGCVVSFMLTHPLDELLLATLRRYEGVDFVIGHLGVGIAPPVLGTLPADPFANLPAVLDLARLPNLYFGLTGAPSLSHEPFPFRDIWDPIRRVLDAFGSRRVLWGADYTRTNGLFSYWEATHYLREIPDLTGADLDRVYGGTLAQLVGWQPER